VQVRTALPLLAAASAAALIAAAAGARPARTFQPAGARLTLDLPAGWRETEPGKGWRFEAIGPGASGWVFLSVVRAEVSSPSFRRSLVAFERRQAASLGEHVTFRTRSTIIATERAIEIYAAGRGTTAQLVYGFQHAGLEYLLVYATTTSRLRVMRPAFAASVRSVRFVASTR
jgi:hypothetical protein